jgi:hypothetical protein
MDFHWRSKSPISVVHRRVGAHRFRPTSVFYNPQEFLDSMDFIGRAHAMRPYTMESIDLTPRILDSPIEKLEHRVFVESDHENWVVKIHRPAPFYLSISLANRYGSQSFKRFQTLAFKTLFLVNYYFKRQ